MHNTSIVLDSDSSGDGDVSIEEGDVGVCSSDNDSDDDEVVSPDIELKKSSKRAAIAKVRLFMHPRPLGRHIGIDG